MNDMARKNMHLPDDVVRLIGDVLHSARFRSETQAVIAMLEGASDRLREIEGYVYLMRGEKGLKIGTSVQPHKRAEYLKSKLLYCISGDRLTELAVHMIWGRYRLSANSEWFEDRKEIVDWFSGHDLLVQMDNVVDGGKNLRVVVSTTAEERQEIERAAVEMGVPVSVYVRLKALKAARS